MPKDTTTMIQVTRAGIEPPTLRTYPSIVLSDPVLSSKAGYSVEEILFMIVLKIVVSEPCV